MSEREPTLQDVLAAVGELRGQVEALGERSRGFQEYEVTRLYGLSVANASSTWPCAWCIRWVLSHQQYGTVALRVGSSPRYVPRKTKVCRRCYDALKAKSERDAGIAE